MEESGEIIVPLIWNCPVASGVKFQIIQYFVNNTNPTRSSLLQFNILRTITGTVLFYCSNFQIELKTFALLARTIKSGNSTAFSQLSNILFATYLDWDGWTRQIYSVTICWVAKIRAKWCVLDQVWPRKRDIMCSKRATNWPCLIWRPRRHLERYREVWWRRKWH